VMENALAIVRFVWKSGCYTLRCSEALVLEMAFNPIYMMRADADDDDDDEAILFLLSLLVIRMHGITLQAKEIVRCNNLHRLSAKWSDQPLLRLDYGVVR